MAEVAIKKAAPITADVYFFVGIVYSLGMAIYKKASEKYFSDAF
jgi:hypothetical protein